MEESQGSSLDDEELARLEESARPSSTTATTKSGIRKFEEFGYSVVGNPVITQVSRQLNWMICSGTITLKWRITKLATHWAPAAWLASALPSIGTLPQRRSCDPSISYGHMGGMRLRTNFAAESRVVTWSCGDRSVSKEIYCVAYNLPGVWRITF